MNSKFLLTTALTAFIALAARAQGGGGGGGSGGSGGSGTGTGTGQGSTGVGQGQGTSQTTPGQPGTVTPGQPGTVTPGQGGVNTPGTAVTPGQGGQTQVTPPPVQNQIAPNVGRNTGQFTGTNAFGMNRNNLNTNAFGVTTNQFLGGTNLAPTGRGNNRILGTNSPGATPTVPH
jgi:hypothetical protein